MGLLTTEVEVRIDSANKNYYKNLGYEIPVHYDKDHKCYRVKKGTTIIVKIEDLHHGSRIKVDVECDGCHNKKDIMYSAYCKRRNQDKIGDKYYCEHCAANIHISGENNHFWNPNLTDEDRENHHKRNTLYNKFIRGVLARDNYTCQCCQKTSKVTNLVAHHLDAFDAYEDKRTDISNGICLCTQCHKAFHHWHLNKYGFENRGNCTKEQFEEWIGHALKLLECNIELPTVKKIYCIEEDKIYESAKEVQKTFGLSHSHMVYNVCDRNKLGGGTIKGKHFLLYDEYLTMTKEEVDYYVNVLKPNRIKQVRCITTGEIFNGQKEAKEKYPQSTHIWDCCKGTATYSGKLPDGTKLQWEYYTLVA